MSGRVIGLALSVGLLVVGCGVSSDALRDPSPRTAIPNEPITLTRRLFLGPQDFGPGYKVSEQWDRQANLNGKFVPFYAVTKVDQNCHPVAWRKLRAVRKAFIWFDRPDGDWTIETLIQFATTRDASASVASARLTMRASLTTPACRGRNLVANSDEDTPADWTLGPRVFATDPHCHVGDDCHGVRTELPPCDPASSVPQDCTPFAEVISHVGPVVFMVASSAARPDGSPQSIDPLISPAKKVARLLRN